MKTLSIVIIGRNEAARLENCLQSVMDEARTIASHVVEILFVDAGSTDESMTIAQRFADVRVIAAGPARPARARNIGFAESKGDLIHFLDADMVLFPGWLRDAALSIEQGWDAVTGWIIEDLGMASLWDRAFGGDWSRTKGAVETVGGAALWRREALSSAGGFDEQLPVGEDPDLSLRVTSAGGRLHQLGRPMVLHALGLRGFRDWWRRGVAVGRSSTIVFERHGKKTSARRRLLSAALGVTMTVAAVAASVSLAALWPLVIPLAHVSSIVLRVSRHDTPTTHAALRALHLHAVKFPFLCGVIPELIRRRAS